MKLTPDDAMNFYRMRLMGLIQSVPGVNKIDFDVDIDSGSTKMIVNAPEINVIAEASFISDIRVMEKFIQDAIFNHIKS